VTKSQPVDCVQTRTGVSGNQPADAAEAVLATVQEVLGRGGEVALGAFGQARVCERGARTGKHPGPGELRQIGATRVPKLAAFGSKRAVRA
jgi:nucleoid DNA-binding protein